MRVACVCIYESFVHIPHRENTYAAPQPPAPETAQCSRNAWRVGAFRLVWGYARMSPLHTSPRVQFTKSPAHTAKHTNIGAAAAPRWVHVCTRVCTSDTHAHTHRNTNTHTHALRHTHTYTHTIYVYLRRCRQRRRQRSHARHYLQSVSSNYTSECG